MSSFTLPKPTGTSVRQLHERLTKEWGPRLLNVDSVFRDLVHQRNNIEILPESDDRNLATVEIHSGRAGLIIDHANGLLMTIPTFHAEPPTLSTLDAREAEQLETAAAGLFQKHLS